MRRNAGFTIVELLIVVVIMGILTAIAVPNFTTWVSNYRLKGAIQTLHGDLMGAKMLAAKQGRQYRIVTAASSISIQQGNLGSGSTAWTTIKTINLADYPGIVAAAAGSIVFLPRGTASGPKIVLTNSRGKQKNITVSTAGRVIINDGG